MTKEWLVFLCTFLIGIDRFLFKEFPAFHQGRIGRTLARKGDLDQVHLL